MMPGIPDGILIPQMGVISPKVTMYFTPEIGDLHVGYECEDWNEYEDMWMFSKFTEKSLSYWLEHRPSEIRTPYLTKEQIEKEGWTALYPSREHREAIWYSKGGFRLKYLPMLSYNIDGYLGIHRTGASEFDFPTIYNGTCKCINEFRKICKLLNIK